MPRAYVGLGANLGDREGTIRRAVELLGEEEGIEVAAVSALRETNPVGVLDQPRFLNAAAAVETTLPPRSLLDALLRIERALGRVRDGTRWGPRTIDLDLLLYDDLVLDEGDLRVPHPELHARAFVLVPLAEIAADLVHPALSKSIGALAAEIDRSGVRERAAAGWPAAAGWQR